MRYAIYAALLAIPLAGCHNNSSVPEGVKPGVSATPVSPKQTTGGDTSIPQGAKSNVAATPVAPTPAVAAPYNGPALIDSVSPGDEDGEKAHNLKGDMDETGDYMDRTYRHSPGGWFSWDLKVVPNDTNILHVTYWGSDQRSFDILIDGKQFVAERINNDKPDEFFEKTYTLTPEMTKDKKTVTVRFQAQNAQGYAGGVFGISIMRPGATTKP